MYNLFRHQIAFCIFVIIVFPLVIYSQANSASYNYLNFKRKSHYFGLTIGYNSSGYKIEHSKRFINNTNYKWNEGISNPGLTLSVIANFKIGDYFDFRVLPSIALSYRSLAYRDLSTNLERIERSESVFGEVPLLVRFTSAPYKDKRVFFLTGVKYSYDFASNSRTNKNQFQIVRISPHDFQFEIGAGMQFYLPFFIFSPEIKFSHGLNNILIFDSKLPESTIIEKLFSKSFSISLHFEG